LNLIGYSNRFDASRIRSELGWQPKFSYRDAITQMEATWKAHAKAGAQ
jgi:nucleoside-diphosphate-sugar epimerase